MATALAQVVSYVERARAFMPPGTVSPFVVRFDAGSVPVGQLVFSSETRSNAEIQDLALNHSASRTFQLCRACQRRRRSAVAAAPSSSRRSRQASFRTACLRKRLAKAIASGNTILPSGNVRTGDLNRIARSTPIVPNINELADLPIRTGSGPTVFVRDIGTVENGSDILTGYGRVNGRRTVYIPVTKRADAVHPRRS